MDRYDLIMWVGDMIAHDVSHQNCLPEGYTLSPGAQECADKFMEMCNDGMDIHKAYVMAFFGGEL